MVSPYSKHFRVEEGKDWGDRPCNNAANATQQQKIPFGFVQLQHFPHSGIFSLQFFRLFLHSRPVGIWQGCLLNLNACLAEPFVFFAKLCRVAY